MEYSPYPEGTACASVLKAGERGGNLPKPLSWVWVSPLLTLHFKKYFM